MKHSILSLALWCIVQPVHAALVPTKSLYKSDTWSLDKCLNDTIGAVASARAAMEKAKKITFTNTDKSTVVAFRKKIGDICAESPIALVMECDAKDCQLSRAKNFAYRALYEEVVVQELCQKIAEKKQVVYTSFGAGGMLQDFIILAKALSKAPDASITIHLIDRSYSGFAAYLKELTFSTKVVQETADISSMMQSVEKKIPKALSTENKKTLYSLFLTTEVRALQFTTTLKTLFPTASLEVFVHGSMQDYTQKLTVSPKEYPDILVAADINDANSLKLYAPQTYFALCKSITKHKKEMVGVYLAQSAFTLGHVYLLKNKSQQPTAST